MSRVSRIKAAQEILKALGLPPAQQNEMAGLVLLALGDLGPNASWIDARRISKTVTKGIMAFISEEYGHKYAPNTRETVRRKVLHQFVQAGIAEYNPDNPNLPTNSPKAHYALTEPVVKVLQAYDSGSYAKAVDSFLSSQPALVDVYRKKRQVRMVPLTAPDGQKLVLSPGAHSLLQARIVEDFAPRFAPGGELLYIGDTAQKTLYVAQLELKKLSVPVGEHDKLPDVLLLDKGSCRLFVVEAVTSHGPVSPKRLHELEGVFSECSFERIYITAFPDIVKFKKHVADIAWETEVWIAAIPDHMIHFNGPKFLKSE